MTNQKQSGLIKKPNKGGIFKKSEPMKICSHPEHRPPAHISIPLDCYYEHVCPACGEVQIIESGALIS
jgi:predicted RNA-binding Zn-ribbon protein involved in translation (DUF1610 family)